MTTWTTPRTWIFDELIDEVIMNTHVRDNLLHLKEQTGIGLQLTNRQGGSATDWSSAGTNNYVPSSFKMEAGIVNVSITTASGSIYVGNTTITFPSAFSQNPLVWVTMKTNLYDPIRVAVNTISTTQAQFICTSFANSITIPVAWIAIGSS